MIYTSENRGLRLSLRLFLVPGGARSAMALDYLDCVDRAEVLNPRNVMLRQRIQSFWLIPLVAFHPVVSMPFEFHPAIKLATMATSLICLWGFIGRILGGYRTSCFVKHPGLGLSGTALWVEEYPDIERFLQANQIHTLGCSEFEFDVMQMWVRKQALKSALTN